MESLSNLFNPAFLMWVLTLSLGLSSANVLVGDIDVHTNKSTVTDRIAIWPNGVVPYKISSDFDESIRNKITSALQNIESSVNSGGNSCVDFVPHTDQTNYIDIYQGTKCHSSVGLQNTGRQEVSIGPGCEFSGIILHELLHALGFYHEHSRHDRDQHVNIDLANVASENTLNFQLEGPNDLSQHDLPYDFDSIMSYEPYTMAVDGSRPVITPLPGQANDVTFQMGQRMWLSDNDVLKIQKLYGCPEDTSNIVRPEKDNTILECNFQTDLCAMTGGGADLDWTRTRDPSPAGPSAGHSTGTDYYLVTQAAGNTGKTAMITTPVSSAGGPCIDFFLFLADTSSSLVIEVSGPQFMATPIPFEPSSWGFGQWVRYQRKVHLPPAFDFQIHFKALVGSSDVALDDIRIYTGLCN